jgi:hypothetical protein
MIVECFLDASELGPEDKLVLYVSSFQKHVVATANLQDSRTDSKSSQKTSVLLESWTVTFAFVLLKETLL